LLFILASYCHSDPYSALIFLNFLPIISSPKIVFPSHLIIGFQSPFLLMWQIPCSVSFLTPSVSRLLFYSTLLLLVSEAPNTTYRKYKETVHLSLIGHPISQPSLDISPIWAPVITAEVRDWVGKLVFLCWYYTENLSLQWCLLFGQYSGARSHTRGVFLMFRLKSRRWFVWCLVFYTLSCVGAGVRRYGLAPSIGPNWVGYTWRRRQNPVSETLCFK
jgi:hypothetical protein